MIYLYIHIHWRYLNDMPLFKVGVKSGMVRGYHIHNYIQENNTIVTQRIVSWQCKALVNFFELTSSIIITWQELFGI